MINDTFTAKLFSYSNGIKLICFVRYYALEEGYENYFYTNDPTYQKLFFEFLEIKGNNIRVTSDAISENIQLESIKHWSLTERVFNNPIIDEIVDDLQNYIKCGVQRSYLLVGEPGTGKTSVCYQVAKRMLGRCIKIDNSVINYYEPNTLEGLLNYSEAKLIIFDDLDRNENEVPLSKMLYYVESFKNFKNKPVFLATANTVEKLDAALLRPGRFDRIISVKNPRTAVREDFIKFMLNDKLISEEDLKKLINITEDFTYASINEVCNQYRVGISVDLIISDIQERAEILEEPEEDTELLSKPIKKKRKIPKGKSIPWEEAIKELTKELRIKD